jgi:glyoxylase-like metal-dependent hydrolase (beta-lactamase superfamily II)/rhodanese-related sulfurtransferase
LIIERYFLGDLAHASYLVGDPVSKEAAVIDPRRDVDLYLDAARAKGLTIEHVLLTHFHADFVAGHLELRERVGATIHVGARGKAGFPHEPVRDGTRIPLGTLAFDVLETPGHTPESCCFVLRQADGKPHAVFTGDTLFVGDVGRPDLLVGKGLTAPTLASWLYDSLRDKLLALPDETLVYPAHGAGSACGKNMSSDPFSTIGAQRRLNVALKPMTREAFVSLVTTDQPDSPAYFGHDAELNQRDRATLGTVLERATRALKLEEVLRLVNAGALLLDARSPDAFAASHVAGSINVGLDGSFMTWAGSVLDPTRALVLVTEPGRERDAATALGRIGFERVEGYLEGGIAAAAGRRDLLAHWERIHPPDLAGRLATAQPPLVLDVRKQDEWNAGHLAGALHVPLNRLVERLADVPRDRPLVVHCRSGYRSSIAASLLAHHGFPAAKLADLSGGILKWTEAKQPVTKS